MLVFGREVEEVLAVFLGGVGCPHLTSCPGHVLDVEGYAVIGDRAADFVHRENVVVDHREVRAGVVGFYACFPVVGGVDVHTPFKHVCRRVGRIDRVDERIADVDVGGEASGGLLRA